FLGEGGHGTVWLAREEATGGAVAIKICLQDIARVGREVSNLKLLHKPRVHPNVVKFLKFVNPGAALVMEFIDGKSLNQRLKEQGAGLDEEEAMWIMRGLLRGVSVLHEKTVIHRDIKPDNIMLRAPGDRCDRVVIVDFGTSKQLTTKTITEAWNVLGTPAYSSPEQTTGSEAELGMDVWAAGVVYFEMLEGHRPFTGDNDKALENKIR
ncbi:kinase-like domain-containing protein, partial [Baffinella frigidus]